MSNFLVYNRYLGIFMGLYICWKDKDNMKGLKITWILVSFYIYEVLSSINNGSPDFLYIIDI